MKQTKQTTEAMPIDKGNGHTPGKVRLGSNLPFDEYACNILTEQNYPIAIAQTNIYFDAETAEANAARIVECWNNYDQLKAENARAKQQIIDLIEALTPFADVWNEFTEIKRRQAGEVFQYNDKKLLVSDFEKANDLLSYLSHHQVK